jgi:hypothetical protein
MGRATLVFVAGEKTPLFEKKVPNAKTVKALRTAERGKGVRLKSVDALFKRLGI